MKIILRNTPIIRASYFYGRIYLSFLFFSLSLSSRLLLLKCQKVRDETLVICHTFIGPWDFLVHFFYNDEPLEHVEPSVRLTQSTQLLWRNKTPTTSTNSINLNINYFILNFILLFLLFLLFDSFSFIHIYIYILYYLIVHLVNYGIAETILFYFMPQFWARARVACHSHTIQYHESSIMPICLLRFVVSMYINIYIYIYI